MKLPIRHEYFKRIKDNVKRIEFRDAHITFVDEKTNEQLRKNVVNVWVTKKHKLPFPLNESPLFTDEHIIAFELEDK